VTDNFPYAEDGPDVWTWLQSWYVAQCNGDWEHSYGIAIDTLDNPGWSVTIDVARAALDPTTYSRREIHRSEDDWCVTYTEGDKFRAACGPTNLAEAIHHFRAWAVTR
jgi:hypothetical protein